MTKHPDPEHVMSWLDDELSADAATALAAHVDGCDACRKEADRLRGVSRHLAAWRVDPSSPRLAARISALFAPSVSRRASPFWRWRRQLGWLAAVLVIGIGATAGIRCATSTVCDFDHVVGVKRSRPASVTMTGRPTEMPTPSFDRAAFASDWAARPRIAMKEQDGTAKVVIVIFIDWQCNACQVLIQIFDPIFGKYQQIYPGALKLVMRDYPLDTKCNSAIPATMHSAACEAAAAVRIARDAEKGDAMIAWLHGNYSTLTADGVKKALASIAGVSDFDARYPSKLDAIRADVAEAQNFHVDATPTMFINGVRLASQHALPTADQISAAIDIELRRAGVIK